MSISKSRFVWHCIHTAIVWMANVHRWDIILRQGYSIRTFTHSNPFNHRCVTRVFSTLCSILAQGGAMSTPSHEYPVKGNSFCRLLLLWFACHSDSSTMRLLSTLILMPLMVGRRRCRAGQQETNHWWHDAVQSPDDKSCQVQVCTSYLRVLIDL